MICCSSSSGDFMLSFSIRSYNYKFKEIKRDRRTVKLGSKLVLQLVHLAQIVSQLEGDNILTDF